MPKTNAQVQGVIEHSRRILGERDPELLEQLSPLLSAAEDGNRRAIDIFQRSVAGPDGYQRSRLMLLLAGLASSSVTGTEPPHPASAKVIPRSEIRLPVAMTHQEALSRAKKFKFDFVAETPAEIEAEIFKGMEYARDELLSGSPEFAFMEEERELTVLDRARIALAERVGRTIIAAFADARAKGADLPPPPSSVDYDAAMRETLGYDQSVLEAWQDWPHWRNVLAYQFVGLVSMKDDADLARDPIAHMEQANEAKRTWYNSLSRLGVDEADIERTLNLLYTRASGFDDLRAAAELRRFIRPDDMKLQQNPNVAALMAEGIERLHARDTSLEFGRFVELLPHFTHPMNFDSIMELLTDPNSRANRSQLYRAQAILAWHLDADTGQIDSLSHIVGGTKGWFRNAEEFCRQMLRLEPTDLLMKIGAMAAAGLYVEPLVAELDEAYPGEFAIDVEELKGGFLAAQEAAALGAAEQDAAMDAAAAEDAALAASAGAEEAAAMGTQLTLNFTNAAAAIKPVK